LIFSDELIEEFVEVASRPKFKKYFSSKDLEKILEYFDQFGQLIKVKTQVEICRDDKDNFLLNLAIDSKADFFNYWGRRSSRYKGNRAAFFCF